MNCEETIPIDYLDVHDQSLPLKTLPRTLATCDAMVEQDLAEREKKRTHRAAEDLHHIHGGVVYRSSSLMRSSSTSFLEVLSGSILEFVCNSKGCNYFAVLPRLVEGMGRVLSFYFMHQDRLA
jgi:hypothetical protein